MARRPRRGRQPDASEPPDRGGNGAEFVAIVRGIPRSLTAGRRYEVALRMRNSGTTTWRATGDQPHRLGSLRPQNTTRWGIGRIDVPADVLPGSEATFTFWIVAPTTCGRYHFQWQMVQDGVSWFGEPSAAVVVQVDQPAGSGPRLSTMQTQAHRPGPRSRPLATARSSRDGAPSVSRSGRTGIAQMAMRFK